MPTWSVWRKTSGNAANVATNLDDLGLLLQAECDENTCRLPFAPTEAVAIGEDIEAAYKPVAEEKQKEGRQKGGGNRRSSKAKRSRANCPKPKQDESARSTAVAAKAVGMSRHTYEKGKEVVHEGGPELPAEMDRTGKVKGAFKKLEKQRAAAIKGGGINE